MSGLYCELCIAPRGVEEARGLARLLRSLGFRWVAVDASTPERARALAEVVRGEGVEAYSRVTVEASDWSQAARMVKRLYEEVDLVAVRPRSAEAARHAARDRRVAVVQLSPGMARYMDKSEAMLLRESGSVVEVRLSTLLGGGDPRLGLRGVMVIARRAAAYEAAFAASSCARSVWEAWPPMSVVGLLASFGVPVPAARLAVTGYCLQALRRARGWR